MKKCAKYICLTSFRLELSHVFWKYIVDIWFDVHLPIIYVLPASRQLKVAKHHSWKSFKYYYLFSSLAKRKKLVSIYYYNLYIVLQKGEMILMKCQVVRHNKSFQISSKIPHYYYPSVAKPLTTLKVICQIIFCIMMSPLPVQCNLHADMAFHEKNNLSK